MRVLSIVATVLALQGCATEGLPPPGPDDCQIRAGAALTEGTTSFTGVGSVAADARGGAVTVIGNCPEDLRVFVRSPSSTVCYGSEQWCTQAWDNAPIPVSPAQLRELVEGDGG